MTSRELQDRLRRRAGRAGIHIPPTVANHLETYLRLLETWNRKINLTGFNLTEPPPEVLDRLLVEPLVAARHIPANARRLMDIGSGGGSPAIPMALAAPSVKLIMVESKTRKAVFLREAVRCVGLDAEVVAFRYEELLARPELHESADVVTMRAVRTEPRVLSSIQAFIRPGGLLFLFRGSTGDLPSEAVPPPLTWTATYPLVESLRSRLVVLEKRPVGRQRAVSQENGSK